MAHLLYQSFLNYLDNMGAIYDLEKKGGLLRVDGDNAYYSTGNPLDGPFAECMIKI